MSEETPQSGPGTRLLILAGWSAYPGYHHFWYRDAASNLERLKTYALPHVTSAFDGLMDPHFARKRGREKAEVT